MQTPSHIRPDEGAGLILLQDCALSSAASLLSILLVRWVSAPIAGFTHLVLIWIGCALVGTLAGVLLTSSHKVVKRWATIQSSARLALAIAVKETVLAIILLAGLVRMPSAALSVLALLADTLLTVLNLFYIRFAGRLFSRREVQQVIRDASRKNALVAGTDSDSVQLAREVEATGEFNVIGFISPDRAMAGRVITNHIVYYCASNNDLKALDWRLGGVDGVFFPKGKGPGSFTQEGDGPAETPAEPAPGGMKLAGQAVKRAFDMGLSGLLIIIFSPLALICALAIKAEDGGPVLFSQERIGRGGRPFRILKFRSMRTDAEADGAQLAAGDEDPRLTRTGAFLRRHHLDELPQLYNVLRGDMSFIGYRPERKYYIEQIMARNPRYAYLYQIRPGVTSYATLYNGYTDTLEKMLTRLDLDLYYLRRQSVWFDLRVLGLTFLSIVSGKKF